MDSRTTSPATQSRCISTTCDASSARDSSPTTRDAATASTPPASVDHPWSLRRRMAVALSSTACAVFLILGVLVYRAVASSTAAQFDEMLQQQAALALRYADHEYSEGESVVPRSPDAAMQAMPLDVVYQITTRADQFLYRSPGAPQAPLAIDHGTGYSNAVLDGRSW